MYTVDNEGLSFSRTLVSWKDERKLEIVSVIKKVPSYKNNYSEGRGGKDNEMLDDKKLFNEFPSFHWFCNANEKITHSPKSLRNALPHKMTTDRQKRVH